MIMNGVRARARAWLGGDQFCTAHCLAIIAVRLLSHHLNRILILLVYTSRNKSIVTLIHHLRKFSWVSFLIIHGRGKFSELFRFHASILFLDLLEWRLVSKNSLIILDS